MMNDRNWPLGTFRQLWPHVVVAQQGPRRTRTIALATPGGVITRRFPRNCRDPRRRRHPLPWKQHPRIWNHTNAASTDARVAFEALRSEFSLGGFSPTRISFSAQTPRTIPKPRTPGDRDDRPRNSSTRNRSVKDTHDPPNRWSCPHRPDAMRSPSTPD